MTVVNMDLEAKTLLPSSPTQRTRKTLLTRTSRPRATEQALEERRKQYQKSGGSHDDNGSREDERVLATRKMLLNLQVTSMRHLLDDSSVGERSQKSESSTRSSKSDRSSNSQKTSPSKSKDSKSTCKKKGVSKAEAILKANQQFTSILESSTGSTGLPLQTPKIDFRKIFETAHAKNKAADSKQPTASSFRDLAARVCAGRNMSFRDIASRKQPSKTNKATALPMESFAEEDEEKEEGHERNNEMELDEFEFDDLFGNENFDEVEWGCSSIIRDRKTTKRGTATEKGNISSFPSTLHFGESFSSILDPFTDNKNDGVEKHHDDSNTVTTASSDSSSLLWSTLSQAAPPRKPIRNKLDRLDIVDSYPQGNHIVSMFDMNANYRQDSSQHIATAKLEKPKASRLPARSCLVMLPTFHSSNDGGYNKCHDDCSVIRSCHRSGIGSSTTSSSSSHSNDRGLRSCRRTVDCPDTRNEEENVHSYHGTSRLNEKNEKKMKD
jgi:hypothetical protein